MLYNIVIELYFCWIEKAGFLLKKSGLRCLACRMTPALLLGHVFCISAAEGFVELDGRKQFVEYGVVQTDLRFQQLTLGVEKRRCSWSLR